jgi:uncharacterized membrane protein YsdA (DUF1294 family)
MSHLIYFIAAANVAAMVQIAIDKRLAEKQKNRISEAQLIAPTFFGGFPGILLGMILFRHKTKKRSFQLKLLFALILLIGSVWFIYSHGNIQSAHW